MSTSLPPVSAYGSVSTMTGINLDNPGIRKRPTTLAHMPDDVLQEIAKYLPKRHDVRQHFSTYYDIQPDPRAIPCCQASSETTPPPFRDPYRAYHPDAEIEQSSLLAFAAVNRRIRDCIFGRWLLRYITVSVCGEHWRRLECLSEEFRSHVRTLTIINCADLHSGPDHVRCHADFINLFNYVKRINILWKPLGPDDSRRDRLLPASSSAFVGGQYFVSSQPPILSSIASSDVEKLWFISNNSPNEVDDTLDTIHQLQCIFRQFNFSRLQEMRLRLSHTFSIDDLVSRWTPQRVSFPNLEEIHVRFGLTLGNVHSVDLCAAATHFMRLIDTTDTVSSIQITLSIDIPATPVRSIVWRYGEPAEAPFEDIQLLPGVLPTTAQRLSLLSGMKADYSNLRSLSVHGWLELTGDNDWRGRKDRRTWDFQFPSIYRSREEMAQDWLGLDDEQYLDDDDPIYSYRWDFDPPKVEDFVFNPVSETFDGIENPTASFQVWPRSIRNAEEVHRDMSLSLLPWPADDLELEWEEEERLREEQEWLWEHPNE